MVFLFKTLLFLAIVAMIGGLIVNNVPSLKQAALEFLNPAVKEGRLLAQVGTNLDNLAANVSHIAAAKIPAEAKKQIAESQKLVSEAKTALQQVKQLNQQQQQSGLVSQALNKIADAFVDRTIYPADHLTPAGQARGLSSSANGEPSQTCRP